MLHVSTHPICRHKIAQLRDVQTLPADFRRLVGEITEFLFLEATRDLPTRPTTVRTPLTECPAEAVDCRVGIIPILRAGLGMADAALRIWPTAVVWHLGLYRDHHSHQPITYYNRLPPVCDVDVGLIVDPMLATGGSASAAATILKNWGLRSIKFIGLIGAPEGVEVLHRDHPDIDVYLGALDERLNENKYIVPGLGDAGDRQFGTR